MKEEVLNQTGLLLEGGAMRSVFSAGVLDYFLERKLQIPNVLAVSAGAYAGMNYLSEQKGRILKTNIDYLRQEKYIGIGTFLKTGSFFDMDLLFDRMPNQIVPFDFETFRQRGKRFLTSTVNCMTGENVFYSDFENKDNFLQICRAANSLPIIADVVDIDEKPMLDGGMADAIPIHKALEEGWQKVIIILTRNSSYTKKKNNTYIRVVKHFYREYPAFCKTIEKRYAVYNDSLKQIELLEKRGRAFVFRPSSQRVRNNETNVNRLKNYYQYGYEDAKARYDELENFLAQTE